MGSDNAYDENAKEYTSVMGSGLGPLFHALYTECAWLQITWAQYVELFGTNAQRIEMLNEAAGLFFRIVQDTLWESTLLWLARLTDPPQSARRKDNLSIQRIPSLLKSPEEKQEIERLIRLAVKSTEFARDWRNRQIAHRDLSLSIQQGAKPLAPASRKQVKDALTAIYEVIHRVHRIYYPDSDLRLDLTRSGPGGAESLLYLMPVALDAHRGIQDDRRKAAPTNSPRG